MNKSSPKELADLQVLIAKGEDSEAANRTRTLLVLLEAVTERSVRPRMLERALGEMTDPVLLAVLQKIVLSAEQGSAPARSMMTELALSPSVLDSLSSEHLDKLNDLAQQAGLVEVVRLLLLPRINKDKLDQAFDDNEHLPLPLGLRRQAARGNDRNKIDRLLHDRDHRVISLLLNNPSLTERDAVAIAARRPTRPEVLKVLAGHKKWSSRYRVRKALACNPHTPTSIAIRLLPTLMIQDLRFIQNSGALLPELRMQVQALIARRTASRNAIVGEE